MESEDVAVNKTLQSWRRRQIIHKINEQIVINAWKKTKQDNVMRMKREKFIGQPI